MNNEKATLKIKIYRKTGSSQLRRRSNKDTLNKKVIERGVEEYKKNTEIFLFYELRNKI